MAVPPAPPNPKDWILLSPSRCKAEGFTSKFLPFCLFPVAEVVDKKNFGSVQLLHKIHNHVVCAFCREKVALNVASHLVGTTAATAAKVSFQNVDSHLTRNHSDISFLKSSAFTF